MASRCICDRIEATLEGLPWFRQLPAGARWLCFKLVQRMALPAFDGAIPYSDARRVSVEVSMELTETETYLETLIEKGLLARDEGGRLTCPAMETISARVRASRENGRKGGRPPKAVTVTPQTDPRQITQSLPITGGKKAEAEKPSETRRWETPSAGAAPRTTSSSSSSSLKSESTPVAAREREWQEVAQSVIATARLTLKRPDWTPAKAWLEAGATPELVMRAVAEVMARPSFEASRVSTIGYFTPAILRAVEKPPATIAGERAFYGHEPTDFELRFRAWEEGGHRGPPPRLAQSQQHAA